MGDERNIIFLSTMPASGRDRAVALVVVGTSAVLFTCAVPFATVPLTPVPAFIASYQSALSINDLITAVLLFSQFALLRSRALLVLASGYLFTAAAAIVHALSSPACSLRRTVQLRRPDHSLALPDLAQRLPASGARLCLLKEEDGGPKIRGATSNAIYAIVLGVIATIVGCLFHLDRHCPARSVAGAASRRPLHTDHDRCRVLCVVAELHRAAIPVGPSPTFGARHLAHGRDVRLVVRHRVVRKSSTSRASISASTSAVSTAFAPRASCSRSC